MVEEDKKLILSKEGQTKYLTKLIGKVLKALHLIEEEDETKISPVAYIKHQLLEINSANDLFAGELATIIVKFNLILVNYEELSFAEKRRQILEINNQIKHLISVREK